MMEKQESLSPAQENSPKKHKLWLWLLLAAFVVGGLFAWTWYVLGQDSEAKISSYEECVAAGHPVAESYPEQCIVPDGETFTRELSQEEQDSLDKAAYEYTSEKGVSVRVFLPTSGEKVASPLVVLGAVPGSWSFEASFPIELRDGEGRILARGHGELQADWMTQELVPFVAVLEFDSPGGDSGTLVLMKDNPSGLGENEDSVTIPIIFE